MTIRYETGNLLESPTEALVNTVNEVGVMGKGIALQFSDTFPANAEEYRRAAAAGNVRVGRVLVTPNVSLLGPRWIIHFPTKKHWRHPSKMEWIRSGLADLERVVRKHGIRSIALPPLGCGNGGLDWSQVQPEIETTLGSLRDVDVVVYFPATSTIPGQGRGPDAGSRDRGGAASPGGARVQEGGFWPPSSRSPL